MDNKISTKIKKLEDEIRKMPYHKGTEHHIGLLRARIARLKQRQAEEQSGSKKRGGGYFLGKQGDATCILIGPPSAGKSTLINALTEARSKTGGYDFTTLDVVPGMMFYRGARIQILDPPGLIAGALSGAGSGKKIISVGRAADLIILITDVDRTDWLEKIRLVLHQSGFRLNSQPPRIEIKKQVRGGIRIVDPYRLFKKETISAVANEFGLKNGEIVIRERLKSIDQLIDAFSKRTIYLPAIEVVNKIDQRRPKPENDERLLISAAKNIGLERLKRAIWQKLGLIRVYLKEEKKKQPDRDRPLILRKGAKVSDAVEAVSSDLADQTGGALIWGPGARFPGQQVNLNFTLKDKTVVLFTKKKVRSKF